MNIHIELDVMQYDIDDKFFCLNVADTDQSSDDGKCKHAGEY